MASGNDYKVNFDDDRLTSVDKEKASAEANSNSMYNSMISKSDKFYQDQINASKEYAETQKKNQQAATEFAIDEIEQQKANAKKDYLKEQSGAYVDWQKESNRYGANAEAMAAQGMAGTGYSESSQVSMYNQYQNRVTTARESFVRAVQNYDNAITEARLQNNSALAEIAYTALQDQLSLALQGFQYKNQLVIEKANRSLEIKKYYDDKWRTVLDQINKENSLAESARQHDEEMAYKKAALEEEKRQFNETMAWNKAKASGSGSGGTVKQTSSGSGSSSKVKSGKLNPNDVTPIKETSKVSAYDYLNKLISSGATKDKVANEISLALRNKEITAKEAQKLRSTFTPRGLQY